MKSVQLRHVSKQLNHIIFLILFCMAGMVVVAIPEAGAEDALSGYLLRSPGEDYPEQFRKDQAFDYTREVVTFDWWQRVRMWLAEHVFRNASPVRLDWIETGLKILAVVAVLFFIYRIIRVKYSSPFAKKIRLFDTGVTGISGTLDRESYPKLVGDAVAAGDYTLAIRIHYWYILHQMNEKEMIRWDVHKTNMSYIYEIKNESLRKHFHRLSYIFDCVCYGEFQVNTVLYQQLEAEFYEFQQKITG